MAKVICGLKCKYRSKRPMRNYKYKDGRPCYGCTRDTISITRVFDPDGDMVATVGEENMACCIYYEPIEDEYEEEYEDE